MGAIAVLLPSPANKWLKNLSYSCGLARVFLTIGHLVVVLCYSLYYLRNMWECVGEWVNEKHQLYSTLDKGAIYSTVQKS